jgi:hypothetical protein
VGGDATFGDPGADGEVAPIPAVLPGVRKSAGLCIPVIIIDGRDGAETNWSLA